MPFKDLFDPNDEDYFFANKILPGRPLHFIHIPKTAGSSLREELRERLRPYANLALDYSVKAVRLPLQMPHVVSQFLRDWETRKIICSAGHIPYMHICRYACVCPSVRFFTFLRNPLDRCVSDYCYQWTSAHPQRDEFVQEFPNFDLFLQSERHQNRLYRHLNAYPYESVNSIIERLERSFLFVGTVEDYDLGFRVLTAAIGKETSPRKFVNRRHATEAPVVEPTAEQIETFNELNTSDIQLYKLVSERWAKNRGLIQRKLESVRETEAKWP